MTCMTGVTLICMGKRPGETVFNSSKSLVLVCMLIMLITGETRNEIDTLFKARNPVLGTAHRPPRPLCTLGKPHDVVT